MLRSNSWVSFTVFCRILRELWLSGLIVSVLIIISARMHVVSMSIQLHVRVNVFGSVTWVSPHIRVLGLPGLCNPLHAVQHFSQPPGRQMPPAELLCDGQPHRCRILGNGHRTASKLISESDGINVVDLEVYLGKWAAMRCYSMDPTRYDRRLTDLYYRIWYGS